MTKKALLSITLLIVNISLFAQINGTKTIGKSGSDYTTINAAITDLKTKGVNGAVVFKIADGIYDEQITITSITGASAKNSITFESASGDSSKVMLQHSSAALSYDNYTIMFDGAKYINFNKLTLERTKDSASCTVIILKGNSEYNNFTNCVIRNQSTNSATTFAALVNGFNLPGTNLNYNTFTNNLFENGSHGLYLFGTSSVVTNKGMVVEDNHFKNQYRWACYLAYQEDIIVKGNTFESTSNNSDYTSIFSKYCMNGIKITNNKIYAKKGYGIRMENSEGAKDFGLIANNFINFYSAPSYGLHYSNSGSHNIYHNSISLKSGANTGFYINGVMCRDIIFMNNLISMGTSGKCMNITTNTNYPFHTLNYNNYDLGTGEMGNYKSSSGISTLSDWRIASNHDYNSLSEAVQYTNSKDLYILKATNMSRKGTGALMSPYVTTDIDGTKRNTTTPDIGAHEFTNFNFSLKLVTKIDTNCQYENETLSVVVYNRCNLSFDGDFPIGYKYADKAIVTETFSLNNFNPNDSINLTFSKALKFDKMGVNTLTVKNLATFDSNKSDDSVTIDVFTKKSADLDFPTDTNLCPDQSITLDAGVGMDSYQWSTGEQAQHITIDSTGVGIGTKTISIITKSGDCEAKATVNVNFVVCNKINKNDKDQNISIYPNPTNGKVIVNYNGKTLFDADVEIYNSIGELVLSTSTYNSEINLIELKPGIYHIHIKSRKTQFTRTIIKQ